MRQPLELPNIDAALRGGVRGGWLTILSGSVASGKTALLYQLALNQATAGREVILIPVGDESTASRRLLEQNLSLPLPQTLRWPLPNQRLRDLDALERNLHSHHYSFRPEVLLLDELDLLQIGASAPDAIKKDKSRQPHYLTERLFRLAKVHDLFIVVGQRADELAGTSFPYLTGLGGNKVTDFADLVLHVHRPEHEPGLSEYERNYRHGQLKLELVKNRIGPQTHEDLYLDSDSGRVILASEHESISAAARPPSDWSQPRCRPSSLAERAAASAANHADLSLVRAL